MTKKYVTLTYIFIFIIFFVARLLFLDEDLPPWGIINYQPVDEGAYSMLALNLYNYGEISPEVLGGDVEYITSPHIRTNILGNFFVYVGLKLLGDNYWGLRIGSVVCGFFILAILLAIIDHLSKARGISPRFRHALNIGCLLYFTLDFNFTMACRVMETSIYRLLLIMLIILAFVKIREKIFIKFLVLTLLTTFSVFGVYITNVFVCLAIFITLIGYGIKYGKKSFFKGFSGMICGGILMLIPLEIYYIKVWDTLAIKNMFSAITAFSTQAGYTLNSSFWTIIKTSVHFLASNVNLYNITLLAAMILSIPYLLYLIIKHKDLTVLFLVSLVVSLYLQTLVSEDYIVRKYIIVYPVLLILLCIVATHRWHIKSLLIRMFNGSHGMRNRFLLVIYMILSIIICLGVFIFRFYRIADGTKNDFKDIDILMIVLMGCLSLALFIGSIYKYIKGKRIIFTFIGCILCALSIHVYLSINYIYFNRSYTEKQCMIDIGQIVGNDYVIGSFFPMGYTLYNDIKPIITSTDIMVQAYDEYPDLWCLDYTDQGDSGLRGYLDSLFIDSEYQLINYKNFERNFSTFGICRDVALYKAQSKNE